MMQSLTSSMTALLCFLLEKTSDPQAPKVRKAKKFFDATNSAAAHVYATPKDYFRHNYYEAVDVVIYEL